MSSIEKSIKILIADDDKDLCNLIFDIICDEGFNVNKVYNGKSALNEILRDEYDLVIIDNKLTGMSGIDVIEESKHFKPSLRTLMISAYGNLATKSKAKELGVYDFIDKPFDVNDLISIVKRVVSQN